MCSYLKLVLDLAGVGLRVQPADVVVERAELAHGDGGVAAEARFQDGVMHEHVLLLQGRGRRGQGTRSGQRPGSMLSTCRPAAAKDGCDLCCRINHFFLSCNRKGQVSMVFFSDHLSYGEFGPSC